ncbi:hypothetical protein HGM15179_017096, partial [Zosterops borbonicus]
VGHEGSRFSQNPKGGGGGGGGKGGGSEFLSDHTFPIPAPHGGIPNPPTSQENIQSIPRIILTREIPPSDIWIPGKRKFMEIPPNLEVLGVEDSLPEGSGKVGFVWKTGINIQNTGKAE